VAIQRYFLASSPNPVIFKNMLSYLEAIDRIEKYAARGVEAYHNAKKYNLM
jgi:hypothetical protein